MTAAKSSDDLKGVGLQMALELVHQEANEDMLTGLRTRTIAGRPNWKQVSDTFSYMSHICDPCNKEKVYASGLNFKKTTFSWNLNSHSFQ